MTIVRSHAGIKSKRSRKSLVKIWKYFPFSNRFPRYGEIQNYMKLLSEQFYTTVRVETIGKSYQGRDIDMIVLSKCKNKQSKHAVFIDANIHAREWLSNSTILYFIHHVIRNQGLLNMMDFYIVPCLNPDGYEYTHTTNRLWRKNLNTNNSIDVQRHGVDLNRNFTYGYGLKGSSDDPGSFMYRGVCPLSEPETQALANTLEKYGKQIKLYISIHCYGNVIMFPWGYTKEHLHDRTILENCGQAGKNAMRRAGLSNRHFKVGSTASRMYISSGGSADYAKGCQNIKFAFTIELQKYGKSGFTPSPKRIVEIGDETAIGIIAMIKFVHQYYRRKTREDKNSEREHEHVNFRNVGN